MTKHIELVISILILTIQACAPAASLPPISTQTVPPVPKALPTRPLVSSTLPTATSAPTVTAESRPSETQLPIFIFIPSAQKPTRTRIPTKTATIEPTPSDTPSPEPTATPVCEHETATLSLSVTAENVKVGEAVKVTLALSNEGCLALGMPQYDLRIQPEGQAIFEPGDPPQVTHYLAVAPGESDTVEFDITAVAEGQVGLTASVSYEVHLGYPGPAYWGYRSSGEPLIITVAP